MEKKKDISDKPEAYPQPSPEDSQLRHQTEFIGEKPNDFQDERVSDKPSTKQENTRADKDSE